MPELTFFVDKQIGELVFFMDNYWIRNVKLIMHFNFLKRSENGKWKLQ